MPQVDFNTPYQQMFTKMFYGDQVDYGQLPVGFAAYGRNDQTWIVARMLAVLKAVPAGVDLETATLPVEAVEFEEGLSQLETLR